MKKQMLVKLILCAMAVFCTPVFAQEKMGKTSHWSGAFFTVMNSYTGDWQNATGTFSIYGGRTAGDRLRLCSNDNEELPCLTLIGGAETTLNMDAGDVFQAYDGSTLVGTLRLAGSYLASPLNVDGAITTSSDITAATSTITGQNGVFDYINAYGASITYLNVLYLTLGFEYATGAIHADGNIETSQNFGASGSVYASGSADFGGGVDAATATFNTSLTTPYVIVKDIWSTGSIAVVGGIVSAGGIDASTSTIQGLHLIGHADVSSPLFLGWNLFATGTGNFTGGITSAGGIDASTSTVQAQNLQVGTVNATGDISTTSGINANDDIDASGTINTHAGFYGATATITATDTVGGLDIGGGYGGGTGSTFDTDGNGYINGNLTIDGSVSGISAVQSTNMFATDVFVNNTVYARKGQFYSLVATSTADSIAVAGSIYATGTMYASQGAQFGTQAANFAIINNGGQFLHGVTSSQFGIVYDSSTIFSTPTFAFTVPGGNLNQGSGGYLQFTNNGPALSMGSFYRNAEGNWIVGTGHDSILELGESRLNYYADANVDGGAVAGASYYSPTRYLILSGKANEPVMRMWNNYKASEPIMFELFSNAYASATHVPVYAVTTAGNVYASGTVSATTLTAPTLSFTDGTVHQTLTGQFANFKNLNASNTIFASSTIMTTSSASGALNLPYGGIIASGPVVISANIYSALPGGTATLIVENTSSLTSSSAISARNPTGYAYECTGTTGTCFLASESSGISISSTTTSGTSIYGKSATGRAGYFYTTGNFAAGYGPLILLATGAPTGADITIDDRATTAQRSAIRIHNNSYTSPFFELQTDGDIYSSGTLNFASGSVRINNKNAVDSPTADHPTAVFSLDSPATATQYFTQGGSASLAAGLNPTVAVSFAHDFQSIIAPVVTGATSECTTIYVSNVTAAGFTINCVGTTTDTRTVYWLAYGKWDG